MSNSKRACRHKDFSQVAEVSVVPKWKRIIQIREWTVYFQQGPALYAFSLATVYLTVLSFGVLMTAYLNWSGMTEAELSIYRGLGALAGVSMTFIFPPLQHSIGRPCLELFVPSYNEICIRSLWAYAISSRLHQSRPWFWACSIVFHSSWLLQQMFAMLNYATKR